MTTTARSTSSVSARILPPPGHGMGDGRQAGAGGRTGPVSAEGPVSGAPNTPLQLRILTSEDGVWLGLL